MASRRGIAFAALAFILIASIQANSQFGRDESQEDQKTEFNLASTLTGGISSSRHRQRANLNSQLYPGLSQLGGGYAGASGAGTGAIDDAHGHEQGGLGMRVASTNSVVFPGNPTGQQVPGYPPPGYPAQQAPVPYPAGGGSAPGYPAPEGSQPPFLYPRGAQGQQAGVVPGSPGYYPGTSPYPGYPYPGVYLPQYPGYPQPAQFPQYGVLPGATTHPGVPGVAGVAGVPGVPGVAGVPGVPGVAGNYGPATSTQNHYRYPDHDPAGPNHWDHHFAMNTEYKEDGVHKGAFGTLNNHNAFGYGSGYGGGYNGAFNSPAY